MTVGRLEREMSQVELVEWLALHRIEADEAEEARIAQEARAGAQRAKARPRK